LHCYKFLVNWHHIFNLFRMIWNCIQMRIYKITDVIWKKKVEFTCRNHSFVRKLLNFTIITGIIVFKIKSNEKRIKILYFRTFSFPLKFLFIPSLANPATVSYRLFSFFSNQFSNNLARIYSFLWYLTTHISHHLFRNQKPPSINIPAITSIMNPVNSPILLQSLLNKNKINLIYKYN
jgi:hypothetical protein